MYSGSNSLALPLFLFPSSPVSFVSLFHSLYLPLPPSGGCHHSDSTVPMLQYEDQEGCSLSPIATTSIGCEHRVAHINTPSPSSHQQQPIYAPPACRCQLPRLATHTCADQTDGPHKETVVVLKAWMRLDELVCREHKGGEAVHPRGNNNNG